MAVLINGAAAVMAQPAATLVTNTSHTLVFDKTGYDYANIYLIVGTHTTNGGDLSTIRLAEHSSVTVPTNMTNIEAFTGGTNVLAGSTGFTIPDDTLTGLGCIFEFQVDLRKRKKKIALIATQSNAGCNFASMALLHRGNASKDTAALKSSGVTCHTNTSTSLVTKVITG
jgi:hypothetical protein